MFRVSTVVYWCRGIWSPVVWCWMLWYSLIHEELQRRFKTYRFILCSGDIRRLRGTIKITICVYWTFSSFINYLTAHKYLRSKLISVSHSGVTLIPELMTHTCADDSHLSWWLTGDSISVMLMWAALSRTNIWTLWTFDYSLFWQDLTRQVKLWVKSALCGDSGSGSGSGSFSPSSESDETPGV